MKKILIINPNIINGFFSKFFINKLKILISEFDVSVLNIDSKYDDNISVNEIQSLLFEKFIQIQNDSNIIENLIKIQPNILHFEEFPETFLSETIFDNILNLKETLKFKITDTTYRNDFDSEDKKFITDRTMFISKENYTKFCTVLKDTQVIEWDGKLISSREEKLKSLGLNPDLKHVMNVDFFISQKNQSEIFDYAKKLENKNVQFHFFGDRVDVFSDYWESLIQNKPQNCKIWEKSPKIHNFLDCMDLLISTSKLENRPLHIIEAQNYEIPILMYNLPNYGDDFKKTNVQFLTNNLDYNVEMIKRVLELNNEFMPTNSKNEIKIETKKQEKDLKKVSRKISAYHMLTDIDSEREVLSMISLTQLKEFGIEYNYCINKRYTDLPPSETCEYPDKISFEPGGKLTPGHYGCYLAHRGAFYRGMESDSDFIFIFECDCVIDVEMNEFIDKLEFACNILDKTDLLMFSFGYHNNMFIMDQFDEYWTVNKFYGAHAYLIPRRSFENIKRMYETSKWNVTDLLFVEKLDQYKTGIFPTPPTKQTAGWSILDKIYNEDRH